MSRWSRVSGDRRGKRRRIRMGSRRTSKSTVVVVHGGPPLPLPPLPLPLPPRPRPLPGSPPNLGASLTPANADADIRPGTFGASAGGGPSFGAASALGAAALFPSGGSRLLRGPPPPIAPLSAASKPRDMPSAGRDFRAAAPAPAGAGFVVPAGSGAFASEGDTVDEEGPALD